MNLNAHRKLAKRMHLCIKMLKNKLQPARTGIKSEQNFNENA
jgi:hypothetical protein